jgi:lysophospholipase L1-like esterase
LAVDGLAAGYNQATMRWLAAVLILGVLLVAAGAAVRTRSASAGSAIVGYPDSIASLGDSITRAFDADPTMFGEQLENSWSTGTSSSVDSIYSRLLAVHSPILGNRYNDALSGAQMTGLNGQAQNAVSQGADEVLILMGANDVCTSSEASMTPVATFQTQFLQAMQTLTSGLPDARISVISIPDVYNLWAILHDNASARSVWSFASICQSLLANPTSMAAADVQRRANVRQRNIDFNTVLHDGCALYAHCRFDNYVGFNTVFTTDDVSTLDYFHPSVNGQALIAAVAWANFYDFSDTTTPSSSPSPTPTPSSSPSPTPMTTNTPRKQGDLNCDGAIDGRDALRPVRAAAGLPLTPPGGCPILGSGSPKFGDVNCDGLVSVVDGLLILEYAGGASIMPTPQPGCTPIGQPLFG